MKSIHGVLGYAHEIKRTTIFGASLIYTEPPVPHCSNLKNVLKDRWDGYGRLF